MTGPVSSFVRMLSLMKRFTSCSTAISSSLALCSNRPFFSAVSLIAALGLPSAYQWLTLTAMALAPINAEHEAYCFAIDATVVALVHRTAFSFVVLQSCARSINRKPHPATTGHALRAYNSNKYWKSLITRYFQGSQFQKGYAPMASVPRLVRDVVFDHQRRYAAA